MRVACQFLNASKQRVVNLTKGAAYHAPVLVDVLLQGSEQEAEDLLHVLGEGLLDISAPLGGQRLESHHVLCQTEEDEHHQLCLSFLMSQNETDSMSTAEMLKSLQISSEMQKVIIHEDTSHILGK